MAKNIGEQVVERDMVSFFVEEFVKMKSTAEGIMSCYQQPDPFTLGIPLMHSYLDFVRKRAKIICQTTAAQLLVKDNVYSGTLCVDESTSETIGLYGKAVILTAGGDAVLFSVNVHPECVSGDGYALGLKTGAEAINLEFMQIFTMTTAPIRNLIHFVNEEYLSNIYNIERKKFLSRYLPEGITLAECIISGTIAGQQAAVCAQNLARIEHLSYQPKELIAAKPDLAKEYAHLIMEIRQSAWDNLSVIKSASSISHFNYRIDEIGKEARRIAADPTAVPVEVDNLLVLGKALAKTALERKESRGGFYREDYPVPAQGRPEAHILRLSEARGGSIAKRSS